MLASLSPKLLSDASWSLMGNAFAVLGSVALVKVTAATVSPDDYGEASLALGVVGLLNSGLLGPFLTTHARLYFDYRERGMARWYSHVIARTCMGIALITCAAYALISTVY